MGLLHFSTTLFQPSFCSSTTRVTVMLSQPIPPILLSGARHLVSNASQILSGLSPRPILGLIKSTTCWLLSTSQIPSQASTINSWLSFRFILITSGHAVTICSSADLELFLNSKSPRALLSASVPFTLLYSTNPPAALILRNSPSLQGLWSNERGIAWPHELRQALESPQLACRRMNGLIRIRIRIHKFIPRLIWGF